MAARHPRPLGGVQPGSSAKPSPTDSTSTASVTMCSHLFGDLFVDLDFHPGLLVADFLLPLMPLPLRRMSRQNFLSYASIHPTLKACWTASAFSDFVGSLPTRLNASKILSAGSSKNFLTQQFPTVTVCPVILLTSTHSSMIGKCPQRHLSGSCPCKLRRSPIPASLRPRSWRRSGP